MGDLVPREIKLTINMRGKFIAIYGINNIGKTTHSLRLVERLKKMGKKVKYIKYPIYDLKPTGPFINSVLRKKASQKITEEELQLWFVLNRYQFEPELKKMLDRGITVLAEDYVGTGLAWGAAKGANLSELESMNKFLVQPDVSIFMDGQPKESAREKKHLHEQNDALMKKCAEIYKKLAKKYKWKKVVVAEDKEITANRIWMACNKYV